MEFSYFENADLGIIYSSLKLSIVFLCFVHFTRRVYTKKALIEDLKSAIFLFIVNLIFEVLYASFFHPVIPSSCGVCPFF